MGNVDGIQGGHYHTEHGCNNQQFDQCKSVFVPIRLFFHLEHHFVCRVGRREGPMIHCHLYFGHP